MVKTYNLSSGESYCQTCGGKDIAELTREEICYDICDEDCGFCEVGSDLRVCVDCMTRVGITDPYYDDNLYPESIVEILESGECTNLAPDVVACARLIPA